MESKVYSVGLSGNLEFFVQVCQLWKEGGVFLKVRTLDGNRVIRIMDFDFFPRVERVVSSKDRFEGGLVNFVEVSRFGAPKPISIARSGWYGTLTVYLPFRLQRAQRVACF